MFKYNPLSSIPKVAMALIGTSLVLSTTEGMGMPQFSQEPEPSEKIECFGRWHITGTTYDRKPVNESRLGYVYDQGCGIYWQGHSYASCQFTTGLDGRLAYWYNLNPTQDRCPDSVQVYNEFPRPHELFQVTIYPLP